VAVTLELTFSKIILRTTDPAHEAYAMSIAGKVENKNIGEFTYALSSQNLEKINKVFNGVQLPKAEVVKGHSFLNQMREKYLNYKRPKINRSAVFRRKKQKRNPKTATNRICYD
jgi:hypothetical protein